MRSRSLTMAAMVVWFIFAIFVVCGVVVAVGCRKNGNVLVLKKVIRRTAVCPDEIYRVNSFPGKWVLACSKKKLAKARAYGTWTDAI